MKIISIELENFIPFKGKNEVEFSDGLNLINGSIGGGKSSFFNAFYWCLFNRIYVTDEGWISNPDKAEIINAIVFNELKVGDKASCKVSLLIETEENYIETSTKIKFRIVRSFEIKRTIDSVSTTNINFEIFYDDPETGTIHEDNISLVETIIENRIFPKVLSDYVWFQGESLDKLIDLERSASFKKVIDSISYLNYYDIIKEVLLKTEKKLEFSKRKKINNNSANQKRVNEINSKIKSYKNDIVDESVIDDIQSEIDGLKIKIAEMESKLSSKEEIDKLLNERNINKADIKLNLTQISSLDEQYKRQFIEGWMINGLGPLFDDAESKIADFEIWRTKEINKERELPDDVPGDRYLNLMISEEKCMICGRDAKEGSSEHIHIKSLLNRRSRSEVLNPEIEMLNNNIQRIKGYTNQLKVKHDNIKHEIKSWRLEEEKLNKNKQMLVLQKSKIDESINKFEGKSGSPINDGQLKVSKIFSMVKDYEAKITSLKVKMKTSLGRNEISANEIRKLDKELDSISLEEGIEIGENQQLERIKHIIDAVEKTIKIEYKSLIKDIEKRANGFINQILSHNDSIKAKVSIDPVENDISIIDDNGEPLDMLNTGHKTIIKMSVINSIISKSSEYKEQPFPFLTDAPTSSLGPKDTEAYLKLISNVFEQSIVLSKDFEEIKDFKSKNINVGSIFNLKPVNLDNTKESSLTNTYTSISKI